MHSGDLLWTAVVGSRTVSLQARASFWYEDAEPEEGGKRKKSRSEMIEGAQVQTITRTLKFVAM